MCWYIFNFTIHQIPVPIKYNSDISKDVFELQYRSFCKVRNMGFADSNFCSNQQGQPLPGLSPSSSYRSSLTSALQPPWNLSSYHRSRQPEAIFIPVLYKYVSHNKQRHLQQGTYIVTRAERFYLHCLINKK